MMRTLPSDYISTMTALRKELSGEQSRNCWSCGHRRRALEIKCTPLGPKTFDCPKVIARDRPASMLLSTGDAGSRSSTCALEINQTAPERGARRTSFRFALTCRCCFARCASLRAIREAAATITQIMCGLSSNNNPNKIG